MQGKKRGMKGRESAQLTVSNRHSDSLVDMVLRRMRGLVMDMWEDYAPAAFSYFKVHLLHSAALLKCMDLSKNQGNPLQINLVKLCHG